MRRIPAALVLILTTARCAPASAAPATPDAAALALIAAAKAGDVTAMQRLYTPAAWDRIDPGLPSQRRLDNATEIKRQADKFSSADVAERSVADNAATVTVRLRHARYDERVRITLARTPAGWQVSDARPPFFTDDWPTTFAIWTLAYDKAKQPTPEATYGSIVKGLDYANAALEDRPDEVTLNWELGHVCFDRLTVAPEPSPFSAWFRIDTRADAHAARPRFRTLLTADGSLLPALTRPTATGGAPLEYLLPYDKPAGDGFPYGVPAVAFAFNYQKRAQRLHETFGQESDEIAPVILDRHPAMDLKFWASDERRLARAAEAVTPPTEASAREMAFEFHRAARVAADALAETDRLIAHVVPTRKPAEYPMRDEVAALLATTNCDLAYLAWLRATGDQRPGLAAAFIAKASLTKAAEYRYAVAAVVPPSSPSYLKLGDGRPLTRDAVMACDPARLEACYMAYEEDLRQSRKSDFMEEDRADIDAEIARLDDRLQRVR